MAASLTVAVGRRIALVLMVAGGVLVDPSAVAGHAQAMMLDGAVCLDRPA